LNAKINNPEIHATLVALTTGVKSYLSDDIRKSFSKSGTMHLLAVSGLHVGYIYSVLLLITSIFGNFRFSVFMRSILIIILLWGYALFTGMAPSIERAVLMATIYQIGTIFGKRKNSLNSLSLSALIICIFDPGAVFDIGFQLSYAATLSIILINPFINRLYQTKNPIMKYVWTTVSISTSCQIGTSILTIYYFKFIPVYFMISNLLAIPLSSIIISTTMILVIAGDSGISVLLVPLLKFLVWMLNESMAIISTLPYPVIEF
jgi:competence protein ComEC